MAAMESLPRPPGASFNPEDADLLTLYLGPKIAGEPLPSTTSPYIHDLDVYSAEPAALVSGLLHASAAKNGGKEWYFYTTVQANSSRDIRRCRTVAGGVGTWHSEKSRQEIVDQEEDRVIGYRHSFTYEPKNGWLMHEYSLVGQEGGRGQGMPVLCKIYRSPHADAPSASKSKASLSMSGSKKRKAAAAQEELSVSGAGSSGRVRRRLHFPSPPPAANPCIEAPAEEAQCAFLVPIEPQTEQEQGAFLVPNESEAEREQGAFLVPIESQTEQESAGLQRGIESQQEPLASMPSARTLLIARVPMVFRRACARALASVGLPFEEWATADEIESSPPMENSRFISPYDACELSCNHNMPSDNAGVWGFPPSTPTSYSTTLSRPAQYWNTPDSSHGIESSLPMGNSGFISPYDACELSCNHTMPSDNAGVLGFPPSTPTPYSTTLSLPAQLWDTPDSSHGIDTSMLPGNGSFSANQATSGMSCYGATTFLSDDTGIWAIPPSAPELPEDSWTAGCCQIY